MLAYVLKTFRNVPAVCLGVATTLKQTMQSTDISAFCTAAAQHRQTFRDVIALRKQQAEHSVLVELPAACNFSNLQDYYSSFGKIKKIAHWKSLTGKKFLVVEFCELHAVNVLLSKCSYQRVHDTVPTFSRLLQCKTLEKLPQSNVTAVDDSNSQDDRTIDKLTENVFVSDTMNIFYQQSMLKDIHIRLRFIMCAVLEDALKGIFPHCKLIPTGSTVNGFGNSISDLDMLLAVNTKFHLGSSRFYHPTKEVPVMPSNVGSHVLSTVGDLFETFLPGISDVKKSMQSTPPVIKFHHHILETNCNVTINNMPALFISELLFLCGELDSRVRPLVFAVKHWAHHAKITFHQNDLWISDYALILMIIFFLQTRPHAILPPLDEVHQGVTNKLEEKSHETLDILLKGFFNFLSSFQFKNKSISVIDAQSLIKPDFSPLYIYDPVNQQLNICRNVSQKQLDYLIETANCTLWNLETASHCDNTDSKNLLDLLISNVNKIASLKC